MSIPTRTESWYRYWATAGDLQHEVERLNHLLWALNQETDPDDAEVVQRRTNAVVAVGRRVGELLAALEAQKP